MAESGDGRPSERVERDVDKSREGRRRLEPPTSFPTETERLRYEHRQIIRAGRDPSELPPALVEARIAAIEAHETEKKDARYPPHAIEYHLNAPDELLTRRLREKSTTSADGRTDATTFTDPAALVMAEGKAWRTRTATEKVNERSAERQNTTPLPPVRQIRIPIEQALGPDWRDHVRGLSKRPDGRIVPTEFPDDTVVYTLWRRDGRGEWQLQTCFPEIPRRAGEVP